MKKIFNTVLIILILSALSFRAGAVVLDSKILKEQIKKDAEEQINRGMPNKKIKVEISDLPYEKIETNGKTVIETKMNLRFFNPLTIIRVNIIVNGEIYKSFTAQAKISIYENVWTATDYIKRGDVLTNVALEERDITYLSKTFTRKNFDPSKHVSKKNYNPGDAIDADYTENIPAIVKDCPVSVIFKTDSVSVVIPAIALDKGSIGDYIKVRSKNYKKDYMGKIISENLVLVNI